MDWIYWTRLVHTLIFLGVSGCIVYIIYCGISKTTNRYLISSLVIVLTVGVIYAINGFECPLATFVHQMAGRRDVPDIFFPDWFANRIMPVSTVIYIIGVVLIARNLYNDRKSKKHSQRTRNPRN